MSKVHLITEALIEEITKAIDKADSIYILTSFVMKSGVDILKKPLQRAVERDAEIKVCTGDYLFVTQPEALQNLTNISEKIEVRLYKSNGKSFHPKAYLFQYGDDDGSLIIGSSNMSRSAYTHGVEWNLMMNSETSIDTYEKAVREFMKLFLHEQTVPINDETIGEYKKLYDQYHRENPNLIRTWTKAEETELMIPKTQDTKTVEIVKETQENYGPISPRHAQIEALEALEIVKEEGYEKAMCVMATGLGKTYLAGFFAQDYNRILFIAHTEEILKQAKRSFQHIMPERIYGIYNGTTKEHRADTVFASIFTLANERHLNKFKENSFDLIIIDEFHHAAAKSYQRVLDYFQPDFLLGITATPDRMDGKDVYGICDGNVAYQLHFIEAIQRQWLAPFHYIGVYDETDYSQITWLGSRYDEEELLRAQLREDMAQKIFESWEKHKQTRTLGFCSSIKQANFLANYFKSKGVRATSLHSQGSEIPRAEAIKMIENDQLEIIFTVDLFNEGTDIPSLDTLLFVRPTESLTIFTQQIGRGLRLADGKKHCTIIDLIGNYRNADNKLSLLDTRTADERKKSADAIPQVPENCFADFDLDVINLINELRKKRQPRKEQLRHAYLDLKMELGRRPSYLELHLYGDSNAVEYYQEFKSYIGFLYWAEELDKHEEEVFKANEAWLKEVERTGMSKSYKMIVLSYMLSRGLDGWLSPVTPEETASYFHKYLTAKEYRKRIDFSDKQGKRLWDYDKNKVAKLIADMPMSKWSGSSKGLLTFEGGVFRPAFDVEPGHNETLYEWTKEICEYRLHRYFERKSN
ncbi:MULTISPECIES: DEAD/DEAH box helicase family protein [Bacillaceae]|uniref:DEAD/DEAH box helicase family protein n=1 Tax=Evansella alkalicola TaxID=745819 RepID=A0ABS6K048_9BACI|nr:MULTISPECIES: DEAD/DEAH box helicase family protein [Bacillaceae]MBU9723817.1 DEAD/DEAH box helicase family protein [Bacillus alkalicola]